MRGPNRNRTAETTGHPKGSSRLAALAFEQFRSGLYRFLLRRLRGTGNAEDLAQEVYLRLLRSVDPGQVKCPQAYVYRVAFNVLYEFKLRQRGDPIAFDSQMIDQAAEKLADDDALPDEVYADEAKGRRLEQVIAQLPPMQRAALRLATQHDLSHAQIADKLGISVSTMRNHLYKAIDSCRQRLAGTDE